jgi:hypothetical protein
VHVPQVYLCVCPSGLDTGASAGALIAFVFPGLLAFNTEGGWVPNRLMSSRQVFRIIGGWVLLALGALQARLALRCHHPACLPACPF